MNNKKCFIEYKKAFSSFWREGFLDSDHQALQILKKYLSSQYATSLESIVLSDKHAEHIHHDLIRNGFQFFESELFVKESNCTVPHLFYIHEDGGMVRLKPEGNGEENSIAHGVKCVLQNPLDHTYESEAFKLDDQGFPLPKGVRESDFINLDESVRGDFDHKDKWLDWVMGKVHFPIHTS